MSERLDETEADLHTRRSRALEEGWRGEIEGIDLTTLGSLTRKRDELRRHQQTVVMLGPTRPRAASD